MGRVLVPLKENEKIIRLGNRLSLGLVRTYLVLAKYVRWSDLRELFRPTDESENFFVIERQELEKIKGKAN